MKYPSPETLTQRSIDSKNQLNIKYKKFYFKYCMYMFNVSEFEICTRQIYMACVCRQHELL